MRVQSLRGLTALGLAGLTLASPGSLPLPDAGYDAAYTCPAAATTTVFITVGSAIDPAPQVAVQTVTATVWPPTEPQWTPASPIPSASFTITIDGYGPPGGSQYTGANPWKSSVITSTVLNVPTLIDPVASDPGNVGGNPPDFPAQSTPTALTLSAGQSPPSVPWNPTQTVTTDCTSMTAAPGGSDGPGGSGASTAGVTVITTTLYHTHANPDQATQAVDTVVASFTVTFPEPTPSGVVLTNTVYAPSVTEPPSGPANDGSVTSFTTTLYRTQPGSGSGSPTVDTLVTCFTVTFPSSAGTVPSLPPNGSGGNPSVSVGTITRLVPTMVPGPDGQLSSSVQTLFSTFTAPIGTPPDASAPVVTTTYVVPGSEVSSQQPTLGQPVISTLTLNVPQPSASVAVSQPPVSTVIPEGGSFPGSDSVTVVTATVAQPAPNPASLPADSVVTVIVTSGAPSVEGPTSVGVSSSGVSPVVPTSAGSPDSPGSVSYTVITQTGPQTDFVPGGYGDSAPSTSIPGPVGGAPSSIQAPVQSLTITIPGAFTAGSGSSQGSPGGGAPPAASAPADGAPISSEILGGYGDAAQQTTLAAPTVAPGPAGSPSVITLWPSSQDTVQSTAQSTISNTLLSTGGPTSGDATPVTDVSTSSCTSTAQHGATDVTATTVLTSTLVNTVAEASTTYTFPFESLVTSLTEIAVGGATVSVSTISASTLGAGSLSASTVSASIISASTISASTISASTISASTIADSPAGSAQTSFLLSTWIQSTLVQSTLITTGPQPTLIQRRGLQKRQDNSTATATALTPAASPICTGTTEVGNLTLNFDDLVYGPITNPYHRFWFSKGFLVGPPPAMPYLPTSGGRVVEYVPPMLSNDTGRFSSDTAQIGMGKLASAPCFQFDFFGMNLGCDSRVSDQLCEFTFTGYQWNATDGEETESVSQNAWVPSCPDMRNCPLTPFSPAGFVGLSSILITLRVDGRPQVWWTDDLRVGWSNNDCDSALCRQQPIPVEVTSDNEPVRFWTPLGIRILKPSRILKHFRV